MSKNNLDLIEQQELIQKLIDAGHGKFVDALLLNENKAYTKKARLNKSGACRVLGCKTKDLENTLAECRRILDGGESES